MGDLSYGAVGQNATLCDGLCNRCGALELDARIRTVNMSRIWFLVALASICASGQLDIHPEMITIRSSVPEENVPQLDHQDHHHQQFEQESTLLMKLLDQKLI